MALIRLGGGIIQISGSIAGNTFARNRFGNYMRARTKPINPNTGRQATIRAAIASLCVRWSSTLTALQRAAWNQYAANVAMKNKLGEVVFLSGFNHYIRSNVPAVQAGITITDAGPTINELPAQDSSFAVAAASGTQTISYTFDNTLDWAGEVGAYLLKYQGNPQNAQRNFFKGPWRYHGKIDGAGTPPTSPDAETDPPYVFAINQRQWCYARIRRADGRLSAPFAADCFCT